MTRKINVPTLGQDVLDLINAGGGGGGGGTIYVPIRQFLAGPNPGGVISGTAPVNYGFVGNALSASAYTAFFNYGTPRVEYAALTAVWTPGSTALEIQCIHADDGPTNIVELGSFTAPSSGNPIVTGVQFTAAFDALAQAGVRKNILWRIRGNTSYTIYSVFLEIVWRYTI